MRIWSLHPCYLDSKGLVALWREALLAKQVLEGKTKGYKNHPQLERFRKANNPVDCINQYLVTVYHESRSRGYNFNRDKINWNFTKNTLHVTNGQLRYEMRHLINKLKVRDPKRYMHFKGHSKIEPHPLFIEINGNVESWEKILNTRTKD